jgi:hypothetical protein
LYRDLNNKGILFLSCPSIKKICGSYVDNGCESLILGRKKRFPNWNLHGYPNSQIVNELFHQGNQHKNLFDYELLSYTLFKCGFSVVEEINEQRFLDHCESFPRRFDDEQSLYILASK